MDTDNDRRGNALAAREPLVQCAQDLDAEGELHHDFSGEGRQLHDNQVSEDERDEGKDAGGKRRERRELLGQMPTHDPSDERRVDVTAQDHTRTSNSGQQLQHELGPQLPAIVNRGMGKATDEPSRENIALINPYAGGSYGALPTNQVTGERHEVLQRTGVSREEFHAWYGEQGGDQEHLFKQTRSKANKSSAAETNIFRSSYLEYLYVSIIMGLAGLMAFGAFLTGADLLLVSLWPAVPHWVHITLLTVSLCVGHSLFFHGFEHFQACCKIPFRTTEALPSEILVVTVSGFYTWALVEGIFQACYKPTAGLTDVFYMMFAELMGGASWALGLDLCQQFYYVELTACKVHAGWSRDHFVVDFLTKLPCTICLVWLMDLFSEHMDMSKGFDRFSFNFVYTCCLFVNFLIIAGGLRDIIFEYRNMVPAASTVTVEDSSA